MLSGLCPRDFVSIALVTGVIFVNGLTDAPNAVSTVISTRCMTTGKALLMSSVFNFLGVFTMSMINNSVAVTVFNLADFGDSYGEASLALSGALFSIVLWSVIAWYFGIPTSESHALLAGLTGGAMAFSGFSGVNGYEWLKAIKGLFFSCAFGFLSGLIICRVVMILFRNMRRDKARSFFRFGQIIASALMSFMHGAQDGQKFIGVLYLVLSLSGGGEMSPNASLPVIIFCSLVMAGGTLFGGKRIIKAVGMDMVSLEEYQGFSADLSASISLLLSTVWGFPVSTTHTKTTAMMGTALAKRSRSVNPAVVKDIALTWVCTFPGCGIIGYVVTRLFLCF